MIATIFTASIVSASIAIAPTETAVDLTTSTGVIHGTLALPSPDDKVGKMPVALIIAGSGPTDRGGNSPMLPGKNNGYKMLADALAAEGIASVRYDKRGIAASRAAGRNEADLRFDMYVDDAAAWVRRLRDDGRFARVIVVGHSEGSLIGMLAAAKAKADGFDRRGQDRRSAAAGDSVGSRSRATVSPQRPALSDSWIQYVPSMIVADLAMPVLIVQGTTDIQVGVDEAKTLKTAKPDAELVLVDGMNHVMKHASADRAANVATYGNPDLPIVPDVPKAIVDFVRRGAR